MEQGIPTRLITALFIVIVSLFAGPFGCRSQMSDRSNERVRAPIACTTDAYDASASAEEKNAVLNGLLASPLPECHVVFYTLLESADERDVPLFRDAFEAHSSCGSVEGMLAYLVQSVALEMQEANAIADRVQGDPSALTEEDHATGNRIVAEIVNKVNAKASSMGRRLGDKRIERVLGENASCVAGKLYAHTFPKKRGPEQYILAEMLRAVIVSIGEPGFAALLEQGFETKEKQLFVAEQLESFGANAVFPLLRHYEKTESEQEADFCFTLILMLPDTEPVYQRVIDAMEHGPFFPKGEKATTVEITTEERARQPAKKGVWRVSVTEAVEKIPWQIIFRSKYKEKPAFAQYAVTHLSAYPDVMMSALLIAADVRVALEYYVDVPPTELEKFVFIGVENGLITPKDVYVPLSDRIRLLERWFDQLPAREEEKRETLLFSVLDFPRAYQMRFAENRFGALTAKEQQHLVVSFCRYPWEETKAFLTGHFRDFLPDQRNYVIQAIVRFPTESMKEAYRAIRPLCTDKEQSFMDYCLKQYGVSP